MGEVLCDKESELDKIFKDLRSFKEQYDYLKLKFDEYKTSHNQDLNFDFSKEIEALNENKKKLNDEKKNDKIKFKNDLFKDLLDVYENLSQCLKSEHTLITQDFNTLNKFWNDTSICIDYLMCSAESIEKIKGF